MLNKLIEAINNHVNKLNSLGYEDTFEDVCEYLIDKLEEDE